MSNDKIHKFSMTEAQAEIIFGLINSEIKATHNWIASAVENGEPARAKNLVDRLRELQKLYAGFNIEAMRDIASWQKEEIKTDHVLKI